VHPPGDLEASLKEIQLRPNTGVGDLKRKADAANEFLRSGEQVRLILKFRGREIVHPHIGELAVRWILTNCAPNGSPQGEPRLDGKVMTVVLNPRKRG
jgi:translation initiation factor IF-3